MADLQRENLCECGICQLSYQVISFVEALVGPRELAALVKEIKPENYTSVTQESFEKFVIAKVLINSIAEYGTRHGVHPHLISSSFELAWNRRASFLANQVSRDEFKIPREAIPNDGGQEQP